MNYRMICFVIGRILLTEAALLMLPMAVALGYGEAAAPFLIPALLLVLIGLLLGLRSCSCAGSGTVTAGLLGRDGDSVSRKLGCSLDVRGIILLLLCFYFYFCGGYTSLIYHSCTAKSFNSCHCFAPPCEFFDFSNPFIGRTPRKVYSLPGVFIFYFLNCYRLFSTSKLLVLMDSLFSS